MALFMFKPGDDVGTLEDWPFDNPESEYRVREGNPQASGRLEMGGPGHTTRFGIWRCTKGVFDCIEQGDELMTILSGHCRLTDHSDGKVYELGPGDTLLSRDGRRVTWDVIEDVTKVFYAHKADGY